MWTVLSRHFASQEGGNGRKGAAAVLTQLANGRYSPLVEVGELPKVDMNQICEGRLSAPEMDVLEAYVVAATQSISKLSPSGKGRQSPWLPNWVEMVAFRALLLHQVPSAVLGLASCE